MTNQIALSFGPPAPAPQPPETWRRWHELEWRNGRPYRWRLDTARSYGSELSEYVVSAPPSFRWELEVWNEDSETWRRVNYHARRDEVWAGVRDEALQLEEEAYGG